MFSLLHASERTREDRPSATVDAIPPHTAAETVRHGAWPDATQVWVWAGTTATSGYGPIAANFL